MLLHLREDDQGGGPHFKDIFWAHRLKGLFGPPHLEGVLRLKIKALIVLVLATMATPAKALCPQFCQV